MNILFIDNDKDLLSIFQYIDSMNDYHVDICDGTTDLIEIYTKNNYDMVIVDFSLDFGKTALDYILKTDPKQRVITISEKLISSEDKGGSYCQENYNKLRIMKPISINELVDHIVHFDTKTCKFVNKFDCKFGLLSIMNDIVRRFYGVKFDEDKKIITLNDPINTADIMTLLNKYKINYKYINDNEIIILD